MKKKEASRVSWLDWLLYFGSKDERHRHAADRAGHLAFWLAFGVALVDFLIRFKPGQGDPLALVPSVGGDLLILVGVGGFYGFQWIRQGVTFADLPSQKKLLRIVAPLLGLGAAGVLVFRCLPVLGLVPGVLVALAGGACTSLLAWALFSATNAWARRRAESGAVDSAED